MAETILPPKQIPLGKTGKFALVDAADYDFISQWKWSTSGKSWRYAKRTIVVDGKYSAILMHRLLMNASKGMEVDHIDRDGLNNQRSNLRLCTRAENSRNRPACHNTRGPFKGVRRVSMFNYKAVIGFQGKVIHLGYFRSPYDAATVYNFKALELFGEFARYNEPKPCPQS